MITSSFSFCCFCESGVSLTEFLENSFYDYLEECLLRDPNMSVKEIQESFFKDKKNITPEMRAKIEKVSVALVQDLVAVTANYIKNRENDGPLTEEELLKISDEIKQKHPTLSRYYGQNLSKMFRKAFDETKAVIENNPDCLNGEINRKTVTSLFRDAIGKVYSFGKEIDRILIERKEKKAESIKRFLLFYLRRIKTQLIVNKL